MMRPEAWISALILVVCAGHASRADETRASVAAVAGRIVLQVHAVGAQIYECRTDSAGGLVWMFREPIASLFNEGKTVGHHFAGPSWELADGSRIVGMVAAKAAGATDVDIPWLKLTVSDQQGEGMLRPVTTVPRINTVGGVKAGSCTTVGAMVGEPYAADYVFSGP